MSTEREALLKEHDNSKSRMMEEVAKRKAEERLHHATTLELNNVRDDLAAQVALKDKAVAERDEERQRKDRYREEREQARSKATALEEELQQLRKELKEKDAKLEAFPNIAADHYQDVLNKLKAHILEFGWQAGVDRKPCPDPSEIPELEESPVEGVGPTETPALEDQQDLDETEAVMKAVMEYPPDAGHQPSRVAPEVVDLTVTPEVVTTEVVTTEGEASGVAPEVAPEPVAPVVKLEKLPSEGV